MIEAVLINSFVFFELLEIYHNMKIQLLPKYKLEEERSNKQLTHSALAG